MIPYDHFRSGVTFPLVRDILRYEQDAVRARGDYMFVSRATVLGRMRQMKLSAYSDYEGRITMELKELMQLCFNAGGMEQSFGEWWKEYGEDRHTQFLAATADPEVLEVLKGLLNTLETVIEKANVTEGRTDFVDGKVMRWGARAVELIEG